MARRWHRFPVIALGPGFLGTVRYGSCSSAFSFALGWLLVPALGWSAELRYRTAKIHAREAHGDRLLDGPTLYGLLCGIMPQKKEQDTSLLPGFAIPLVRGSLARCYYYNDNYDFNL
jgi:hypothetical protein